MNEQQFIAKVHKKLPKTIYRVKFSDRYAGGIPDTWYSGPAGDLWVEYKYQETPGHKPKLSDLQKNWLIDRHAEGRNVACVVGTPEGVIIYEGTDWLNYKQYVLTPFSEYITWIQHKTTCSESQS
jgi:hypothetical protein